MDVPEVDALARVVEEADEPGLIAAWLFGSRARGDARVDSDADIALLYSTPPSAGLSGLPERVAEAVERVLRADADIVVLNGASPDLIHRVLRDGRLLLDRAPSVRIRFEVRARNEYFDLLPTLRRYRGGTSGRHTNPAGTTPMTDVPLVLKNVLVHDYDEVNLDILRAILSDHLGDLESFARSVRGRLA